MTRRKYIVRGVPGGKWHVINRVTGGFQCSYPTRKEARETAAAYNNVDATVAAQVAARTRAGGKQA